MTFFNKKLNFRPQNPKEEILLNMKGMCLNILKIVFKNFKTVPYYRTMQDCFSAKCVLPWTSN